MGAFPGLLTGNQDADNSKARDRFKESWKIDELPDTINHDQYGLLEAGIIKNMFIFGEDPLSCAVNDEKVKDWFDKAEFIMVQDYYMTETAEKASLVMPASFPFETGGSFTNTQRMIQKIQKWKNKRKDKPEKLSYEQLVDLLNKFDSNGFQSIDDIMSEISSLLSPPDKSKGYSFTHTSRDNYSRMFRYGCDNVNMRFEKEFKKISTDHNI